MSYEPKWGEPGWIHGDEVRRIMRTRADCIPTFKVKEGDIILLSFQPGEFKRVVRVQHKDEVEFLLQDLLGDRPPEMEKAAYGAYAWVAKV